MSEIPFTGEQKQYLSGLTLGTGLAQHFAAIVGQPVPLTVGATPGGGGDPQRQAQDRFLAAGKKLTPEENAKRDKDPLSTWDEMSARAEKGEFPKSTDVFLTKFHGLFYVAPAQDSYMCRLRFPGGIVNSHQLRGVADLAERYGGGYTHITTRANLQIREIGPRDGLHVLTGLMDLGIVNRGSGADNIRNVTASPTCGIDSHELIDTYPLARQMHHYILNHRELYGLPRKFNIAFDGGGSISAVADTNDIGFFAVRVPQEHATPQAPLGVYFRMELGGITGHKDFSRDTGVLLRPEQCVPMAAAVVRVFIAHGDRTDRRKARLKYLLDQWGIEKYMQEVRKELPFEPVMFPLESCEPRHEADPQAHIGVHPQKQPGLNYIGVALPVGKLTCAQMRGLARIADRYGGSTIRLTVWQNLLISDVCDADLNAAKAELESIGLTWNANSLRAGLIACTGNGGCKFAASDTKAHALAIAGYVEQRVELDSPINIHLTGCHHSCAQHYIGDIGLLATRVTPSGSDESVEGYHVYLGGGHGEHRRIAREIYRDVPHDQLPPLVERMVRAYMEHRTDGESFQQFATRHEADALRSIFDAELVEAH